jgi:hypothetical protein
LGLLGKTTLVFLVFLLMQFGYGSIKHARSENFEVLKSLFLVSVKNNDGQWVTKKSRIVPLVPNRSCYRWAIRTNSSKALVKFKEVFELPIAPKIWGGAENEFKTSRTTNQRKTAVTERFFTLKNGWVENSWCVADGDPEGRYKIDVWLDGKFASTFKFKVIDIGSN